MESIYNSIKKDIRNHPDVVLSVLGKVDDWKRSQFVILAEIISQHLSNSALMSLEKRFEFGVTISHITLKRFFEAEYDRKKHNDLRFLKTLEKLCVFLGYEDLSNYIKKGGANESQPKAEDQIPEIFFVDLIFNFCKGQFEAAKKLPITDLSPVLEYIFDSSPLFARIKNFMEQQGKRNISLITKTNRSNFEIFDYTILVKQEDYMVIQTQEFWNLVFKEAKTGNHYFINRLNTQTYFLKKMDGSWKIWDNHNPDSGQIIKA